MGRMVCSFVESFSEIINAVELEVMIQICAMMAASIRRGTEVTAHQEAERLVDWSANRDCALWVSSLRGHQPLLHDPSMPGVKRVSIIPEDIILLSNVLTISF